MGLYPGGWGLKPGELKSWILWYCNIASKGITSEYVLIIHSSFGSLKIYFIDGFLKSNIY